MKPTSLGKVEHFYSHSTICLHCLADANALARVAGKLVDYSRWLGRLEVRSRDFH